MDDRDENPEAALWYKRWMVAQSEVERLKQECADLADNAMKSIAAHDAVDLARLKESQGLWRELRDERAAVEAMARTIDRRLPGEAIRVLTEQRDEAKQRASEWEGRAGEWRVRAEDAEAQLAAALEELAKACHAAQKWHDAVGRNAKRLAELEAASPGRVASPIDAVVGAVLFGEPS